MSVVVVVPRSRPRARVHRRRGGRQQVPWWVLPGVAALVLSAGGVTATAAAPAPVSAPASACAGEGGGKVADFGPDQVANAATIVAVGREMGVPPRGHLIAVATAMQESTLRNLDHGDRDSLGLFQQRPSQGWGSPSQVRDPRYAARKFYDYLLGLPGWEDWPVTVAAQRVQRSAYPDAYAKWERRAAQVIAATHIACTSRS